MKVIIRLGQQRPSSKDKATLLPYHHSRILVSNIHRWFGPENTVHGKPANFSFSPVLGGKRKGDSIIYSKGAYMYFSSYSKDLLWQLLQGIEQSPTLKSEGLEWQINNIQFEKPPTFNGTMCLHTRNVYFKKRVSELKKEEYALSMEKGTQILEEVTLRRLAAVGLPTENFSLSLAPSYEPITWYCRYKNLVHRVSKANILIKAHPESQKFIYYAGLGQSTGIGYGYVELQN
jgi:CRISPR-associated endoribonuclease Cas6